MKWTPDGGRICIIYEDGAVIVGSVDGNRLWGKELSSSLRLVEWSPDMRSLLFVTADMDILAYDADGNKQKSLALPAQNGDISKEDAAIASVQWFCWGPGLQHKVGGRMGLLLQSQSEAPPGVVDVQPSLAVCFDSGMVQITRGDADSRPVLFDADMIVGAGA